MYSNVRRVRVVDKTGEWFATAFLAPSPLVGESLGKWLTKRAKERGVDATYTPATEQEYQSYKAQQREGATK